MAHIVSYRQDVIDHIKSLLRNGFDQSRENLGQVPEPDTMHVPFFPHLSSSDWNSHFPASDDEPMLLNRNPLPTEIPLQSSDLVSIAAISSERLNIFDGYSMTVALKHCEAGWYRGRSAIALVLIVDCHFTGDQHEYPAFLNILVTVTPACILKHSQRRPQLAHLREVSGTGEISKKKGSLRH